MANSNEKFYYVGLSITHAATEETGIALLDNDLNLLRLDKTYRLNDVKFFLDNFCGKNGTVIAADIPVNQMFLIGKWRQESKHYQSLTVGTDYKSDQQWSKRQSTRGTELCTGLIEEGYSVVRYNFHYSKQAMGLATPLQENTPMACKYLQDMLKEKLGIGGIPTNMMPLSSLKAVVGAYIAWQTVHGVEDKDFRKISTFGDLPVYSGI
ncbi:MAG: hypothetical protein WCF95_05310 [bacterium]